MRMPLDFFTYFSQQCKHGVVMPVQSDGEACQRTSKQHKAAFADPGHRERPKQADQATETQPRPAPEARSGLWPHKGQRRPSKLLSGHSFRLSVRQPWQELLETRPRHCFSHKTCSERFFFGFASLSCENGNVKVLLVSIRTFFRFSAPQ